MTMIRFSGRHGGAHLVCAALLFLLVSCSHGGSSGGEETTVSVIVQAPDMQHAIRAVAIAGGTVTHELGIIRSVGATVTPAQLELLHKVKNVQIRGNGAVSLSGETKITASPRAESSVDATVTTVRAQKD